jgi:hypothetical protein
MEVTRQAAMLHPSVERGTGGGGGLGG